MGWVVTPASDRTLLWSTYGNAFDRSTVISLKYSINFIARGIKGGISRVLPESGFRASWGGATKMSHGHRHVSMARWFRGGGFAREIPTESGDAKCIIARALYLCAQDLVTSGDFVMLSGGRVVPAWTALGQYYSTDPLATLP